MSTIHALILGIVQGITEFLPISSSGHLILIPYIFKWPINTLTFDVALHGGTLIAVFLYFLKDWKELFFNRLKRPLLWIIVISSLPAAIAGFVLQDIIEHQLRAPLIVALMIIVMGILLWWVDRKKQMDKLVSDMTLSRGLFIGFAQILALIPGVSRSGITMTAARFLGFDRKTSARFSFLLATPIIAGAFFYTLIKHFSVDLMFEKTMLIGFLASAISGLIAISFLLRFLEQRSYAFFSWYRIFFGLSVISLIFIREIHFILEQIVLAITMVIDKTGYFGVFFFMVLESAGIPIPSEIIMPFAGFLTFIGRFNFIFIALLGTLGNLVGSLIAYYIGKKGGLNFLRKYGKYLLLSEHDVDLSISWFSRYGEIAVFFGRLIPVIRTYISFPAGMAKMNLKKFVIFSLLGTLPWSFALTYLGFVMGENWEQIRSYFERFDLVALAMLILGILILIYRHKKNLDVTIQ